MENYLFMKSFIIESALTDLDLNKVMLIDSNPDFIINNNEILELILS